MLTRPSTRPRTPRVMKSLRASVTAAFRPALLAGSLLQRPVQGVEHDASGVEASSVLAVLEANTSDESAEAARLLTAESGVIEIDVVNHVCDVSQRRVVRPPASEQHLER